MLTKLCGLPTSWRKELPNIHNNFAVAILKNNDTVSHACNTGESAGISCRRVAAQRDDLYRGITTYHVQEHLAVKRGEGIFTKGAYQWELVGPIPGEGMIRSVPGEI